MRVDGQFRSLIIPAPDQREAGASGGSALQCSRALRRHNLLRTLGEYQHLSRWPPCAVPSFLPITTWACTTGLLSLPSDFAYQRFDLLVDLAYRFVLYALRTEADLAGPRRRAIGLEAGGRKL